MNSLSNRSLMLIQKYFRDELSEIEKNEFDKALEEEDFRSEVALQAQVFEGIIEARRDHFREIINEAKGELETSRNIQKDTPAQPKGSKLKWLAVAASVLILVGSLFYLFGRENQQYKNVYAEYYVPYDTPESQRGNGEVTSSSLDDAIKSYENENYSEALSTLESIAPQTESIQLLIANCFLNLNRMEDAEAVLNSLTQSQDLKIVQHAQWYLALSYIKSDKHKLAKELFSKIKSTPDHLYQKRVAKLMVDYGM